MKTACMDARAFVRLLCKPGDEERVPSSNECGGIKVSVALKPIMQAMQLSFSLCLPNV